jgi:two-component system, LuxR family, sensor kinase FixL
MSIAVSVLVVLEGLVILRLLLITTRNRRPWKMVANFDPAGPGGLRSPDTAMAGCVGPLDSSRKAGAPDAVRPRLRRVVKHIEASQGDQAATHARRIFSAPISTKLSARMRRISLDDDGRPSATKASHAVSFERSGGLRYFQEAIGFLPVAIVIVDGKGLMVMVNEQTAKLFGYSLDELVGQPLERLLPDVGLERSNAALYELSARRKDGTETHVEIGTAVMPFDASLTLAFIVDRTERYELNRNRRDLAHLTRVFTIGQLTSSLAHELNQPLTAILSNVQAAQRFMASDPIDLDEVRDILNDIVQDDYRASEIIRRIRAVVKNGDLEVVSVDLAEVIHDVVVLMHSDAISRGLRVTLDLEPRLPPVQGDKVQLQQVVLNLLNNAFDAMEGVQPVDRVVDVKLKRQDNGMVGLAVVDRGHGLAPDRLDKIFKPFFTSKPQGLGLGLSISRSIVEMHRGQLWAENNINRGATFHVTLPVGNMTSEDGSR